MGARDLVHGAAYHAEFEPFARARIAEHHVAEMDTDAEGDFLGAGAGTRLGRGKPLLCLDRRIQGRRGGGLVAGPLDGEEGQDRIADNVEDLAALLDHGACRTIEIDVQQFEEAFDGQRVGKPRRVPQIAIPKRSRESLAIAALDRARQDALANKRTVKGIERVLGDLVLDEHPERQRQRRQDLLHNRQVAGGKPLRRLGRPGNGEPVGRADLHRLLAERDHTRQITGEALPAQALQEREPVDHRVAVQLQTQLRQALLDHPIEGTEREFRIVLRERLEIFDLDTALVGP